MTTRSRAAATVDISASIAPVSSVAASIAFMSGSDRFYPLSIEDFRVARRALVCLAQADQLSDVIRCVRHPDFDGTFPGSRAVS